MERNPKIFTQITNNKLQITTLVWNDKPQDKKQGGGGNQYNGKGKEDDNSKHEKQNYDKHDKVEKQAGQWIIERPGESPEVVIQVNDELPRQDKIELKEGFENIVEVGRRIVFIPRGEKQQRVGVILRLEVSRGKKFAKIDSDGEIYYKLVDKILANER